MTDTARIDAPSASALQEMERPPWRGVNHLALVTPDMDGTVRFYHGVLGMRLVWGIMAGPMRHYFFEIAPGNTVAFFEVAGARTFAKSAGLPVPGHPLQLDHISFNLPDRDALHAMRDRLQGAGVGVTEEVDHGGIHSIYFTDNNGIALEASYWLTDPTVQPGVAGDIHDPDPVPAVRELVEAGELAWLPATRLVDGVNGLD